MKPILRILIDVVILFCIIQAWWFVALPLCLVSIWIFRGFVEIIVAGVIYDSLFGGPTLGAKGYIGTMISILLFLGGLSFKGFVRKR